MADGVEEEGAGPVRGYACDAVNCSPDSVRAVSRFSGGNRHAVYRVSYVHADGAERDLVVRVAFDGSPAGCVQAQREASVLDLVGGVAAPLLYDFRCTSAWFPAPCMCMEFIPGAQHEPGAATIKQLEQLGSVAAAVHARPTDSLALASETTTDIAVYAANRLESILAGRQWLRPPLPAAIRDRLNDAADALQTRWDMQRNAASFKTRGPLAILHGDIAAGNVLWRPEPVLIDWEYSRLGDPADEIAYTFDQNGLTPPQREAFWRGYQHSAGARGRLVDVADRIDWWERLTLLGSTLWWVERWVRRVESDASGTSDPAVPREQSYYLDHISRRTDRLEHLLSRAAPGHPTQSGG